MSENVPYIWRKNYRNEAASPEKVLETGHEQARAYLNRAVPTASSSPAKSSTLPVGPLNLIPDGTITGKKASRKRCEHALELLLTHRGNPAAEVDLILADDPQCIFAH